MQNVELVEEQVYEAPRVESVLTAEELEREVLYAGRGGISGQVA